VITRIEYASDDSGRPAARTALVIRGLWRWSLIVRGEGLSEEHGGLDFRHAMQLARGWVDLGERPGKDKAV
jgi:hypothetical protein